MVNEIEIQVSSRSNVKFDQLGKDAKAAGRDIEDGITKGLKGAEAAGERSVQQIGDTGRRAGQEYGTQFNGAVRDAGGEALGGLMDGLGAASLAGAGAAIGGLLVAGISQSLEERSVGAMLAAQTGAAGNAAGRLGDLAGDIFADNFGDSIAEVGDAMRLVFQTKLVDADAAEGDIKRVTELALGMAKVTGASVDELTQAVRAMLRTGIESAEQAFDLIAAGFRDGANAGGDLLQVLTDSSANLKQFGFDGPTAVGALTQALDAGAPSADAFTGALEELIGNASDGIQTFERLGLGGEAFADQLAGGGPRAAQGWICCWIGYGRSSPRLSGRRPWWSCSARRPLRFRARSWPWIPRRRRRS